MNKSQNRQLAKSAKIVMARRDFAAFVEYVFRDSQGRPVVAADHQLAWRDHLNYCWGITKGAAILSPMSFGKTIWMALALPLWLIGRNPNFRIMIVSSAEDVAAKRLQEIQRFIEDNPYYKEVFPWVKRDPSRAWTQTAANVCRYRLDENGFNSSVDHSISAFGYTAQAGNGARAEVLIFDDVVSKTNSATAANRLSVAQSVNIQWISRNTKEPVYDKEGTLISSLPLIVFIGTRYNPEDYYATQILNNPEGYCTLVQKVSESYHNLDIDLIGHVAEVEHPVLKKYEDWVPPQLELAA